MANGDFSTNFLNLWLTELQKIKHPQAETPRTSSQKIKSFMIEDLLQENKVDSAKLQPTAGQPLAEILNSNLVNLALENLKHNSPPNQQPQNLLNSSNTSIDSFASLLNLTASNNSGNGLLTSCMIKKSKRKARTAFTPYQLSQLETRFLSQKYLTPIDRDEIATSLKLNPAQVITWFQNRRAKMKREMNGSGV